MSYLLAAVLLAPHWTGQALDHFETGDAPGVPAFESSLLPPTELTTRAVATPLAALDPSPDLRLERLQIPVTLNGPVRGWIEFFKTRRGRAIYAGWLARMGRYQAMIEPVLQKHGLPPELIYVCMIESGFSTGAVSSASAVGPWQFISRTAGAFELRMDEWVDERRDPIKATEAAASYFKRLYRRFGSWPLAIAAYNAGEGAVSRGVKRANSNDFWVLASAGVLPDEATRYVPKAMAAMIIGQNPAAHGFGHVIKEPSALGVAVPAPPGLDLAKVARRLDSSLKALETFNPELRRGFTPPDGKDYPLRVPEGHKARAEQVLSRIGRKGPEIFTEHRVRFGEQLRQIARLHGTSQLAIRRANSLPHGQPVTGQVLLVPKSTRSKRRAEPQELLVVADSKLNFRVAGRKLVYLPIKRRMRLDEIAAFFETTPGHVAMWNGLDPDAVLQRGQVLKLYVRPTFDMASAVLVEPAQVTTVEAGTEAAKIALVEAAKERSPTVRHAKHKVRRGDTPGKIAKKYGVSVQALRAENGMSRRSRLNPGDVLKVPTRKTPEPKGVAKRRKPTGSVNSGRRYRVRTGDSLWKIANRFKVEVTALRKRNGIGGRVRLKPGMVLIIP